MRLRYSSLMPYRYPSGPNRFRSLVSIRVLSEYLIRTIFEVNSDGGSLRKLRNMQESISQDVLVITGGPSAGELSLEKVRELQSKSLLKVVFVNYLFDSQVGQSVSPDFQVLSDPLTKISRREEIAKTHDLWCFLEANPEVQIVVPRTWKMDLGGISNPVIYFDDRSLQGLSRSVNPTRPRGYKSHTTLKALAFSTYISKGTVHVIGFDNSTFLGLELGNKTSMLGPNHVGKAGSAAKSLESIHPDGLQDLFFDIANTCYDTKKCFGMKRIVNLSRRSFIDAFPFTDPLGLRESSAS